jgi:hypothetical protein
MKSLKCTNAYRIKKINDKCQSRLNVQISGHGIQLFHYPVDEKKMG